MNTGAVILLLASVGAVGYAMGQRRRSPCPPCEARRRSRGNVARALIRTHDALGHVRPVLEDLADGRRLSVSSFARLTRELAQ